MTSLTAPLGLLTNALVPPSSSSSSSGSLSSMAQQFAAMLEQMIESASGSSKVGTQIGASVNSAPAPGAGTPISFGLNPPPGAPSPSASTTAATAGGTSGADGSGGTPSAPIQPDTPPPVWSAFPGFGPDTVLSSTPLAPDTTPAPPDFYQAPPTQSVVNSAGNAVKTLDSYMQEQLAMVERGGTANMMEGTPGWDLQSLVNSFFLQAKTLAVDANNVSDPQIAPANWQQVAQNYADQYTQWLSTADASYWDPKLSGPVYHPATGVLQTPSGPQTISLQAASSAASTTT